MNISLFADEAATAFDQQLACLTVLGLDLVEIRNLWGTNVADASDEMLARAHGLLDEQSKRVSAIGSPIGKSKLADDFDAELARFERAIVAADTLGTTLIRVFSFYGDDRTEVMRRMRELATRAESAGVTLVHENEGGLYGDTPERCRDIIDTVGSPALRSCFDPANFVVSGVRPFDEAWPLLADSVAHVHIKDAIGERIVEPGAGDAQLPELLDALQGYEGIYTLEPHLSRVPDYISARRATYAFRALLDR